MGGSCSKKVPKQLKTEQQVFAGPFYVETNLDDVPNWAGLEWHNILRQTEMSMDQDNLDLATQKLKEGEKSLQDNQEMFEDMRKPRNNM